MLERELNADFLNPFVKSVHNVLSEVIYEKPGRDKLELKTKYPFLTSEVAIIVGFTGDIVGQVVISMDIDCARGIAAKMMMEEDIPELDEFAKSALGELANMISANATISLSEKGFVADITPPSVITGKKIAVSCPQNIKTLMVPLTVSSGRIELFLSLIENKHIEEEHKNQFTSHDLSMN